MVQVTMSDQNPNPKSIDLSIHWYSTHYLDILPKNSILHVGIQENFKNLLAFSRKFKNLFLKARYVVILTMHVKDVQELVLP